MKNAMNEIYQKIKENSIKRDAAIKNIVEVIYRNPILYGLTRMNEDDQSEFLLYLFTHMNKIIDNYCEGIASFSTYLVHVIQKTRCSWYRNYYHNEARKESVKQYFIEEESRIICEDSVPYTCEDCESYSRFNTSKNTAFIILVIALKCCYYLTPKHIALISSKAGYKESYIYELKESLESKLTNKIFRKQQIQEKINNAYIKKNSCMFELMCIDDNSTLSVRLKSKNLYYTQHWKTYIEKLKLTSLIRPSNNQIAQALHVKSHVIHKIIHNSKILEKDLVT